MNRNESKKSHSLTEAEKQKIEEEQKKLEWERKFLRNLMLKFLGILESIPAEGILNFFSDQLNLHLLQLFVFLGEVSEEKVHYCERFLELMIDLEALLPTRRFFNAVLDDVHLVVRCKLAPLNRRVEGKLFSQV